jgi:cytosine/adenosine deaminase-related metal-dependent hydrolase
MSDPCISLRLVGGMVAVSPQTSERIDIEISGGHIRHLRNPCDGQDSTAAATVNVEGYLLLPGLINAHDHLEFNLFPRIGRGPYPSSEEWARDIYRPECSPVREQLAVPKDLRLWWGGLKNLLSGVTTVFHHNPWASVFDADFPVCVVRRYGWAHSIAFDKKIPEAFAATEGGIPFVIHLGEGTDKRSQEEVFDLDRMGALDQRTVLVHGVAFTDAGHDLWQRRGAALVWCPTSNQFILGTTLNAQSVSRMERIALGSDSALTGRGTLLEEIHAAREAGVPAVSTYRMVTESAAAILQLSKCEGRIQTGAVANLIAVPFTDETPAEAVSGLKLTQVEMVVVSGRLHLASKHMARRWPSQHTESLEWIAIEGIERKVRAPVSWLLAETSKYLCDGINLAGRRVS